MLKAAAGIFIKESAGRGGMVREHELMATPMSTEGVYDVNEVARPVGPKLDVSHTVGRPKPTLGTVKRGPAGTTATGMGKQIAEGGGISAILYRLLGGRR